MHKTLAFVAALFLAACAATPTRDPIHSAPPEVQRDVANAVRDYVDALYLGKPELLDRSVHPDLAKLGLRRPKDATEFGPPEPMSFQKLRSLAAGRSGNKPRDLRPAEIDILDIHDRVASARLVADWGIDYLNLMQIDGAWTIVQIVWQSHPPEQR